LLPSYSLATSASVPSMASLKASTDISATRISPELKDRQRAQCRSPTRGVGWPSGSTRVRGRLGRHRALVCSVSGKCSRSSRWRLPSKNIEGHFSGHHSRFRTREISRGCDIRHRCTDAALAAMKRCPVGVRSFMATQPGINGPRERAASRHCAKELCQ
jgi:hypothetical protein